jgi:hypothetical protein
MARLFLRLGCILAVIGCLVSVLGFCSSVAALISSWHTMTDETLGRPFFWAYAFVMNGALCVVFSRVMERESREAAPRVVQRSPHDLKSAGGEGAGNPSPGGGG